MDKRNEIREELNELSPFLSKLKDKGDGFTTPVNYFDSLSAEIMQKTGLNKQKQPGIWEQFINSLHLLLQPRYAMALASLAILIVAGLYFLKPNTTNSSFQPIMAELTTEEIGDYITSHIDEFEMELLVEAEEEEVEIPVEQQEMEEYLDNIIDEIDIEELEELL